MAENIIVFLVIAAAAFFAGRRALRAWRMARRGKSACGCAGCGQNELIGDLRPKRARNKAQPRDKDASSPPRS